MNEFVSAHRVSIAALAANRSCFPPSAIVALEVVVTSLWVFFIIWTLEILDLVVFTSASPFAAHRDSVSFAFLAANLDFANLLVVETLIDEAVLVAVVDVGTVAGEALALGRTIGVFKTVIGGVERRVSSTSSVTWSSLKINVYQRNFQKGKK